MMERNKNPFTNSLSIGYYQMVTEFDSKGEISKSFEIEEEKYAKIYIRPDKRNYIFSSLSMYARDMYLFIIYNTNINYEYTILTFDKVYELYKHQDPKYGIRRYESTIRELYKATVLDLKDRSRNQYWINPYYFFVGNRLKVFPQCKVKKDTINTLLQHQPTENMQVST